MSEYSDLITAASPIAWYRLNFASGNDSSGNSRTITWTDAPSNAADDALANDGDGAAHFNGSSDAGYIADADVFSPFTNTNFTAEFWANPDTNHVGRILFKSGEWELSWGEGGSSNQFFCNIRKTDNNLIKYVVETGTSTAGNWYHVAMTWNGTTLKLYKNGVDVTNAVVDDAVSGNGNTSNPVYVGYNGSSGHFDGKLDEVAIYNTALSATEILKHYEVGAGISTYQAVDAVKTVTLTPYAATVVISGSATITADLATITFTPYTADVALGSLVTLDSVSTVTYTPYTATITADNSNSFTCFDGTVQSFVGTFAHVNGASSGGSYDTNGVYYNPYVGGGSNGSTRGYSFILTIPAEAVIDTLVTITASATFVNNVAGNQGLINVYDLDGGSPSTVYNAIALTGSGTTTDSDTRALTFANIGFNWVAGRTYRFEVVWERNGSTVDGNAVQLDSLTLYYKTGTSATITAETPTVTFTPYDPSVTSGQQTILTVDNVAQNAYEAYDSTIVTPGTVSIGVPLVTVAFTTFDASLSVDASITQNTTNTPEVSYIAYTPFVDPNAIGINFKFIDKSSTERTAADASVLTSLAMGAVLFSQVKYFGFRLGNISNYISTFTVTASSVNNLEDMVTFSTTKDGTYSSSLTVEDIQPNGITDVIWGKLTVSASAIVDNGTFLIHVEQNYA